jgi:hypothetical protein
MNENRTVAPKRYTFSTFEEMMYQEIYSNYVICNETILHKPYPKDGK